MRLISLTIARNEAWVIGYSLRAALGWVDHAVVLLHACEDETPEIVEAVSHETGRVTILQESNPSFDEMDYRQRMLEAARLLGATHIALIDADEVASANLAEAIRKRASLLPPGGVLVSPIHNLWRSLDQYRNDKTPYGKGWVVLAFGDHGRARWKPQTDGYQFHQRLPDGCWLSPMRFPTDRETGGLMHVQHANWRRMTAKHAWYKATEVVRWPHRDREEISKLYNRALDETDIRCLPVPESWWQHGIDRDLIDLTATPWHEAELRRMIAEHGQPMFTELDFFGLV